MKTHLMFHLVDNYCFLLCVAGIPMPIVDGLPTTIEIPKGNSDLGLSVSWAEREVSQNACVCVLILAVCMLSDKLPSLCSL